jgi:hypothetical protein
MAVAQTMTDAIAEAGRLEGIQRANLAIAHGLSFWIN